MITDGKKWHYLAVKKLSALLRGKKSNHNGGFYCLNCFHLYRTKNETSKSITMYVKIVIIVMKKCQTKTTKY